jgi:hypothetical protein
MESILIIKFHFLFVKILFETIRFFFAVLIED